MADLSTMFPDNQGLGSGWFNGVQNANQSQIANTNAGLNQQAFLQKMMQDQQMNPIQVQQAGADLQKTLLSNTGQDTKNQDAALTFQMRKQAAPQEYNTMVSKMATELSDSELKQANNQIEKNLQSDDPSVRADAQAHALLHQDVIKKRDEIAATGTERMSEIKQQGANAAEVARITAQGRIDAKNAGGSGGKGEASIIAKLGFEKAAVYYDFKAQESEANGDDDEATKFHTQADKMKQSYERAKILAAQAAGGGKPDAAAIANLPATPSPVPQGFTPPPIAPQSIQQAVIAAGHPYEPDKYDYRIGPNGKVQSKPKGP